MPVGIAAFGTAILTFIIKVWEWVSGRGKRRLTNSRVEWEEKSRIALLNGDLDGLRMARAEIETIDRKLASGDYT